MHEQCWVPLRVHSQYSILDATASTKKIAQRAVDHGFPAVAITDHGNLFGAVEFFKNCRSAGVKPIIGCDIYEAPQSRLEKKRAPGKRVSYSLVLLAKDDRGYHNLCKLSSQGYLEGFYYYPRVDQELLEKYREGLICIAGGASSRIGVEALENRDNLIPTVQWYQDVFGEDFYFDLQRHEMTEQNLQDEGFYKESWLIQKYQEYIAQQRQVNERLLEVGKELGIKVVATNDSHYLDRHEWEAHEVLINIQSGEPCEIWENDAAGNPKFRRSNPKRRTYPSHELDFKTAEQMQERFHDIPEALATTLEIADKCNLELDFKTRHYPRYIAPRLEGTTFTDEEQAQASEEYLRGLCAEGIKKRYTPERLAKVREIYPDKDPMDVIHGRLEHEMDVIASKGMCDYLLIVWDFIDWAKGQGIPVGPGRGSGAGSIVLYLIGVTDMEPLRFSLFFERFINPERPSYPDIDVDICMHRREEVIKYTLQKYGKENVAQIITFGTMKAKMVIRDVGRMLSVPLAKVNHIAKLVPDELNITLEKALEIDPDFRRTCEEDEDAKRIIDVGMKLEGSVRSTGIHAAGIIVCGEKLTDHIPLCVAKDSDIPATQFSMKPVEAVGMLKIDFLGLKTLTSIQICADAVKANHGIEIDWRNLPLDDAATFKLLNTGNTLGVFQVETGGMQDLARQLHLDKFEEIIAVLSLYRPGPMDMIPSFVSRKHGREEIENDHPWMKDILAETYGIMVYQEQVMQIAQTLANYSLGEGDVLRRAMGKKDKEQMQTQREKFGQGAIANGIEESTAMQIFDKMEKFASYGFNKSHAAAYGYITYITAYMKANYPREWMAAMLTCDRDDITKVSRLIGECQAMGIPVLPPNVNQSGKEFAATPEGIRFAMTGIKGVGEGVVEEIIAEREGTGPFKSFYDFLSRGQKRRIGKKVAENLAQAGSFDFTGWHRDALVESVETMYDAATKENKENTAGVMTLFDMMGETNEKRFAQQPKIKNPSTPQAIYLKEKELLGFFLTGHPLESQKNRLKTLSCVPLEKAMAASREIVFRTAFIVEDVQTKMTSKSQRKFAILTISDGGHERYEVAAWPDLYAEKAEILTENQLLYAVLQTEEGGRLTCRWVENLMNVGETIIRECDYAYDRAKLQMTKFSPKAKKQEKDKEKKNVKEKVKQETPKQTLVEIDLDAEKTTLSTILSLKKLLSDHAGKTPTKIYFTTENRRLATLHLNYGVNVDREWSKALERVVKKPFTISNRS